MKNNKALVLFSGGQDSTTCLYWALDKFEHVEALFIDYGQRHLIEKESAKTIAEKATIKLNFIDTPVFQQLGDSSLTNTEDSISDQHKGNKNLPSSFVPGRNIYLLTVAAAMAYKLGIKNIITGTCETDYSGYPDCREETIQSLEKTLNLGMEGDFTIHTPLMHLAKAQSILLAKKFEGCFEALAYSHTCYEGQRPPCKTCPSCILREKGFKEAEFEDPIYNLFV